MPRPLGPPGVRVWLGRREPIRGWEQTHAIENANLFAVRDRRARG